MRGEPALLLLAAITVEGSYQAGLRELEGGVLPLFMEP